MHASTRRLALRAAAKVALTVSFASCGGAVATSPDAGEPPADGSQPSFDANADVLAVIDATVPVDAAMVPEAGGDAAVCGAPVAGTDAGISEGTFTCCVSEVRMAIGDASFTALPMVLHDPATLACCSAVVRRIDQDQAAMSPDFETDYAAASGTVGVCCDTINPFPVGAACTPWGPPVPPEMPAVGLAVA